jgi:D-serine dehydratase
VGFRTSTEPGAAQRDLPAALTWALARLDEEPLSSLEKGVPARQGLTIGNIADAGLNVTRGDVPTPSMNLRWDRALHNIELMQRYCNQSGAWLAPHGKTTMAPQLYAEQLKAGAWAITIANLPQAQVCRAFGVPRVLWANEPTTDYEIRYIAEQLRGDDGFELYVLVDSLEGVERLANGMRAHRAGRPLQVMVEKGMPGRRCGLRDDADFEDVVHAVVREGPALEFTGVEGYEGIAPGGLTAEALKNVDSYLEQLADLMRRTLNWVPSSSRLIASGGGSFYFDRVVEYLGHSNLPEYQLVLRPGTYVTHESQFGDSFSPFGSTSPRNIGFGTLQAALEVWAGVMSHPEPDLVLLGLGRRDVPFDVANPTPLYRATPEGEVSPLGPGYKIIELNDQHAYLRLPSGSPVEVGDLVGSGISHPCGAFDHWRTILKTDENRNVIGAVRTFF